jgi:hypothetical protein
MTAVGPQQPGYLSHTDAAAAPIDRLTQRQTFLLGHRPQRLPSAPLSVPDESIAFTKRGQHGDRQTFEPAFPVGTFFAQYRLGIQRRPPRRLPHRLLTHHISLSTPAFHPALSGCDGSSVHHDDLDLLYVPQPISKSDVPHTFCILGCTPAWLTAGLTRFAFRGL